MSSELVNCVMDKPDGSESDPVTECCSEANFVAESFCADMASNIALAACFDDVGMLKDEEGCNCNLLIESTYFGEAYVEPAMFDAMNECCADDIPNSEYYECIELQLEGLFGAIEDVDWDPDMPIPSMGDTPDSGALEAFADLTGNLPLDLVECLQEELVALLSNPDVDILSMVQNFGSTVLSSECCVGEFANDPGCNASMAADSGLAMDGDADKATGDTAATNGEEEKEENDIHEDGGSHEEDDKEEVDLDSATNTEDEDVDFTDPESGGIMVNLSFISLLAIGLVGNLVLLY